MNSLGANMKLIVDCAQKLQQLGERLGKDYGMQFRFITDKRTKDKIIVREI